MPAVMWLSVFWVVRGVGRGAGSPGRVEGEFADQFAGVAVDDPDPEVVDEQGDRGAGEAGAEADVVQPGVVAQGDRAAGVDLVVADSVVAGMTGPVGMALGRAL
jgi:hypothetical protein